MPNHFHDMLFNNSGTSEAYGATIHNVHYVEMNYKIYYKIYEHIILIIFEFIKILHFFIL
jgi:hypothetical protein